MSTRGPHLLAPDPATRGPRPASADDDLRVDLVALRTDELVVQGHTVRKVTLGATRQDDGSYAANVASDGATGFIGWRPASDPQAPGQVTARLSRLVISDRKEQEVVAVLRAPPKQIPSLEVSVEQFELSDMKLGRLDLVAQNVGSGASANWRVHRLDITNPDMKLVSSGDWGPAPAGGNRRMHLKFAIDAVDGGAPLGRLGFPDALSRGAGRIEGEVQWLGSPLDIDYPTLAGRVNLAVDNGRFLKVDTGNAARLLALLSLQSLGRNLAADGGAQFTEGFAFASIRADATIDRGILKTENFRMNGASAAVMMSGTLDLRNETQQLSIVVLPEIDASTAALAVGVVNPVLGLGTFLAQFVLKDPLSRAFALQYDVTGSWTEPKITRRTRITPSQTDRDHQMTSTARVAAAQMVSSTRVEDNLKTAAALIDEAAGTGAQLVALPEYFCLMGRRDSDKVALREPDGRWTDPGLPRRAGAHGTASGWSAERCRWKRAEPDRVMNSVLAYGPTGERVARYDKIHLFRFTKGEETYDEARTIAPGSEVTTFVFAPEGGPRLTVGLSVCYDLRFPELYRAMPRPDLILVPAAFTATTGKAHWELLLRARAVENLAYVLAPAQGGRHENGRATYGHSMLIDPWGTVLANRPDGPGVVFGDIDLQVIASCRASLPALEHRTLC